MFSTFKQRLLLGIYIFIILSIPVGAYLASESKTFKSSASEDTNTQLIKNTPKPTTSPARELLSVSESNLLSNPSPSPDSTSDETLSPTIADSFGPTLSLKVSLEGRPAENQSGKLFVGIMEGAISGSPKFLLSFTVDLPKDGAYGNLSLAGLTPGNQYTALLKGSAQIATSQSFSMSPTVTNLGSGEALNMKSGDLNEDNVINSADYTIALQASGSTPGSTNWNELADLNKDGIVNTFDLAIITNNIGQVGASGEWTSPIPKVATPSGGLTSEEDSTFGYWLWIPK